MFPRLRSKEGSHQQDVLVYGGPARNRAVHGDVVVVELLPRAQWWGKSNAIVAENDEGRSLQLLCLIYGET